MRDKASQLSQIDVEENKQKKLTEFGIGTQISFSKENNGFVPQIEVDEE